MRKLKTILFAFMVAASLFATAGTAWARSDGLQRGTAWTDETAPVAPAAGFLLSGISWE
jgi:hypothetical protein